jgi:N utilization substance protein A
MDTIASLGRGELLRVADVVAQEKGISANEVIEALEQAYQTAARRTYGQEHEIIAELDRRTGDIKLFRQLEVADPAEDYAKQISLEAAQAQNPAAQVGDVILDPLPPINLGRIAAQSAKQVIVQRVREAERERQYNEYKDRVGEIVNGIVKRVEYGNVIVDLGRAEAIVRRDETLPRENFRYGDRTGAVDAATVRYDRRVSRSRRREHVGRVGKRHPRPRRAHDRRRQNVDGRHDCRRYSPGFP